MPFDFSQIDARAYAAAGIAATFTPTVGSPVATFVMVDDLEMAEGYDVEIIDGGAVLTCLRADVGTPKRGDQFSANGRTWVVEKPNYSTDPTLVSVVAKEL